MNYAQKNGIALIVIPQVGSLTRLQNLTKEIANQLENQEVRIPKKLRKIDINEIDFKSDRDFYIEKVKTSAERAGLKILEKIKGSEQNIKVRCKKGHETYKTPRSISEGHQCSTCRIEKISKPVILSDGRKFESRTKAAEALGVEKSRVNRAVQKGWKVKGFKIEDVK
jgi:hypothetical protein